MKTFIAVLMIANILILLENLHLIFGISIPWKEMFDFTVMIYVGLCMFGIQQFYMLRHELLGFVLSKMFCVTFYSPTGVETEIVHQELGYKDLYLNMNRFGVMLNAYGHYSANVELNSAVEAYRVAARAAGGISTAGDSTIPHKTLDLLTDPIKSLSPDWLGIFLCKFMRKTTLKAAP